MSGALAGKTVFVAGASSGMGRATAIAAAREGAALVLLARRRDALAEAADMIRHEVRDSEIAAIAADAGDLKELREALSATDLHAIDVVVNSVGTNVAARTFAELTPQSWAGMIDVNLTAAFNLLKAFVPAMRERGGGLIINIASTAARIPDASGAAYQASKAAVLALTHAIMEEEWRNGIRATAILPGMTDTPLLDRRPTQLTREARAAALQPQDVAEACMFVMRLPARAHVPELMIRPSIR